MNGQAPIHIQRWAPADFQNDSFVRSLLLRRDHRTLVFYRQFLDASFIEGGSLPADPSLLSASCLMQKHDVRACLAICMKAGKIQQQGDRLFHARVAREVAEELAYRADQQARGSEGGRRSAAKRALQQSVNQPLDQVVNARSSPPTPAPTPLPAPIASASTSADADAFPAVIGGAEDDRVQIAFLRQEAGTLLRQIGEAGGGDGQAELMRASRTNNGRTITNLEACSSQSWMRVVVDRLTGRLLELRDPGATTLSPKAQQRQDSMRASVLGGVKGDGTWKPGGKK